MIVTNTSYQIEKIASVYDDVQVFCAGIDEQLNEKGYIVPGLGGLYHWLLLSS